MIEKLFFGGNLMKYKIYAVVLTVIGFIWILFAFSINTYFQNRENTEKELRAIQDIATEIEYYEFLIDRGGERMKEVIGAAERLLKTMREPDFQPSKEEIDLDLHKLTWLWLSATPTTKYVALNASGDFSLISSTPLRDELSSFNADQEKLLQFEAIQVRFVDTQLRPFLNRNMDRTTIDSHQERATLITERFASPFTDSSESLLKNREFGNLLLDLLFCTKRIMLPYQRMFGTVGEIREIISKEYPSIRVEPYKPF